MKQDVCDDLKLETFLEILKEKITRLIDFIIEEYPEEIERYEGEDVVDIVIRLLKKRKLQ